MLDTETFLFIYYKNKIKILKVIFLLLKQNN